MEQAEIVVVGGGVAGSTTAAMLGRAGISTILVDLHSTPVSDFRCEKLEKGQLERLRATGLEPAMRAVATPSERLWIARYGRVVSRRPDAQINARYETMVACMREQVRAPASFREGRVVDIQTSPKRQTVALADGTLISARLVVLACGLSRGLGESLGLRRELLSASHSISVGFDLEPAGRAPFPFRALTWYPSRSARRICYLTLFPIGEVTRANLFTYHDAKDPWLQALRQSPKETLTEALPGLERVLGPFKVTGAVRVRAADLYTTHGVEQPGVVLVGDAFATSCPAAGTGLDKVLTDVERLCNRYIPLWLKSPGMDTEKVAAFYQDPQKRSCDAWSLERAYHSRDAAIAQSLAWRLRRRLALLEPGVRYCLLPFARARGNGN